jgi:hypothetical protein
MTVRTDLGNFDYTISSQQPGLSGGGSGAAGGSNAGLASADTSQQLVLTTPHA